MIRKIWSITLLGAMSCVALAGTGNFFEITGSGAAATLDIILCLNGKGPLTCQNYTVTRQTLSIRTVVPNHTYPAAGIKVRTPGFTLSGCTPIANGYCLFSVSDTTPKTIVVSQTFAATLSSSVDTLALSVNTGGALTGTPRIITITNTGPESATNVTYSQSPALPAGTTIAPANCGTIAPSGTCVLTVTPGATPSAIPGDTSPTPITLTIRGNNTNTLVPTINVLAYGSVYQSGFLFSVNDSTPPTGSIGGTVAALTDQAVPPSNGLAWSVDNDSIWGISEVSTTLVPDPATLPALSNCNGATDGSCNTDNIVTFYSPPIRVPATPLANYAAGRCRLSINGLSDWYLPAICEMGPPNTGAGCTLGTQNMRDNLPSGLISDAYWSSTEGNDDPQSNAWVEIFSQNLQQSRFKGITDFGVRCVRSLTQ